ncbi:helicase C-terminal domain-containing protein [Modestobacter italicus]|uniref:helicase C-terminal domain-containing protein n=1 Tax=Modestobacter italicus (strain DSM 44449 / CECT 9708 / BC 501) TaxID=2732864 RepID=UPI00059F0AF5|nr:helicase-related protein [Modestobacter marinus]
MTEAFTAAPHLARLKDFQRQTVRHVVNRFYDGPTPTRRFLVADETGLGKSVVARGVIAETVERLLRDDHTERIDVVYVCSNSDIAAQNLARLNVVGSDRVEFRTRLTMLAAHSHDLNSGAERYGKAINLIAFTPATSFEKGWRTGKAEERALLAVLVERMLEVSGYERTALHRALQGGVHTLDRFRGEIERYRALDLDQTIVNAFATSLQGSPPLAQLERLIVDIGQKRHLTEEQRERTRVITGELRDHLARASVHALEPDLIILDEFQRFRHLLALNQTGGKSEAAELAHHLFNWDQARTLLLSATPYKAFTLAEEDDAGTDHYTDFMTTLEFLSANDEAWLASVRGALAQHRGQLLAGQDVRQVANELRKLLLQFMCRTERPTVDGARIEVSTPATGVTAADLVDYVGLRDLARAVDGQVQVEYWKSAPYFVNFLEGYQVGERLKSRLKQNSQDEALNAALARVSRLNPSGLTRYEPSDMGNARLRALAARTVGDSWWQLLWIPPSMPYIGPDGPYAQPFADRITKQLVFSSWSATPTAIASLLSYEANRLLAEGSSKLTENTATARGRLATLLDYRMEQGRPGAMSTLALFWPHPELARVADLLEAARSSPARLLEATDAEAWVLQRLRNAATTDSSGKSTDVISDFFAWPGSIPSGARQGAANVLSGSLQEEERPDDDEHGQHHSARLAAHVHEALSAASSRHPSPDLAHLAAFSPGNAAWLALNRLVTADDDVDEEALWSAAAVLANGLRSLFNRTESTLLLERLYPDLHYWQAVLAYCRAGNLQAVLDEYLHHLRSTSGEDRLTGSTLRDLARTAVATLSMRPSPYKAFDPDDPDEGIPFSSRFALRYGTARGQAEDVRLPEIRAAFNSPFWPFVLTSTSVGQEGIDFHWWCHSVVHWNTPSNPIDFEQREGRVNRFGGHAVRRNLASSHREDVLRSDEPDPWKAAYDAAKGTLPALGDFCPYWVFPGRYAVERHLLPFPLSKDGARARALKRDLVHYRLALGQPRQEDLLAALGDAMTVTPIDLRPPV